MDTELHTGTGFDVLEKVAYKYFRVIFTTAYDQYAVKAIKFSAVDYLLKPIDVEELQAAVQKAAKKMSDINSGLTLQELLKNIRKPADSDFSVTRATSEGLEFVPLQQIRLIASDPYTYFFLKAGKKIMIIKNLKE